MHGGEHQIKSGSGKLKLVYSQDMRSMHMSGEHLDEMSSVRVWCPASFQTFDTFFVPQQMSQMSIRFLVPVGWYCSSRAHLHACEVRSLMNSPLRPLHSNRIRKSPWHPPPRLGWVQRGTVSLAMPPFINGSCYEYFVRGLE